MVGAGAEAGGGADIRRVEFDDGCGALIAGGGGGGRLAGIWRFISIGGCALVRYGPPELPLLKFTVSFDDGRTLDGGGA